MMENKKDFYTREVENIERKERFSTLHGIEKWSYFKTYYLLKTILLLGTIIAMFAIAVSWIQAKNDVTIYIAVVEEQLQEDATVEIEKKFVNYFNSDDLDIEVFIESVYEANATLFNVKLGLGGVDVIIGDKSAFASYPAGFYMNLEEVLTKETLEKVEPYLCWQENDEGIMYAYAIDLLECNKYQMLQIDRKQKMIAIPTSGLNVDIAARFIDFLWED